MKYWIQLPKETIEVSEGTYMEVAAKAMETTREEKVYNGKECVGYLLITVNV